MLVEVKVPGNESLKTVMLYGWGLGMKYWLLLDVPAAPAAEQVAMDEAFSRARAAFPQVAWDVLQTAFPDTQPAWQEDLKNRALTAPELASRCSSELAEEVLSAAHTYSHNLRVFKTEHEDARHPKCPWCGARNFSVPMIRVHNCADPDNALFLIDLDEDGLHMTPSVGIEEVEFNTRGFVFRLECRECRGEIGLEIRFGRTGRTEFYWHSR